MILPYIVGAGAGLLMFKLVSKSNAANKLEVSFSGRIHKVKLTQITLMVDTVVKNPTKQSFHIRWPFVTLKYKNETIGTSVVKSTDILIEPYSQITVTNMAIELYLLKMSTLAKDVFQALTTGSGHVQIDTQALIPYVTQAGDVPITYTDKISL